MSLQFSRSLRTLRLDSFRLTRIGLILAILLMLGLLTWFFFAKVTIYENSTALEIQSDGRIIATFTETGIQRIEMGQAAVLRLTIGADQPTAALESAIYQVFPDSKQAELVVMPEEPTPQMLGEKVSGRAEVEVAYLTPAQLLMQATGKALDQVDIPLSPQNTQPVEGTEGS